MDKEASSATKHHLAALWDAWALSDSLFDSIATSDHLSTPIALRNPFIFYLGHLPAFSFNTIRKVLPIPHVNEHFEHTFSRGRDPDTDDPSICHDHPSAPTEWPLWEQVLRFRDDVRNAIKENVEKGDLNGAVVRLIIEHEIMHVETLYYMLAQMNDCPARIAPHTLSLPSSDVPWVTVPDGEAVIGRERAPEDFDTFAWDNEYHPGVYHVPEFQMMKHAVTISSYKAFVDADGYRKKALWESEDWEWIKREGIEYPASWRLIDGIVHVLTNVGPRDNSKANKVTTADDVGNWPVSVSLAEARAYARWIGAKIPTEAQWMRAAGRDDSTWAHGLASKPGPVQKGHTSWCGVVGMVGNGWELTSTVFDTFEGFAATPLYPEYSKDFFDGKHFVIKGAAWATHPTAVRPSFRNFYQARYPYVFSKFRLVREVR